MGSFGKITIKIQVPFTLYNIISSEIFTKS